MKNICIINYQAGNLKSLSNALMRSGYAPVISADPEVILSADLAILPGVGAFGDAVDALKTSSLWDTLQTRFSLGRPLLGICLGMQLFFEDSDELGLTNGLGWMRGKIRRLNPGSPSLKVPHMGWNALVQPQTRDSVLPQGSTSLTAQNAASVSAQSRFIGSWLAPELQGWTYFVHSFGLTHMDEEAVVAYCQHGQMIPAIVDNLYESSHTRGRLIGFQFHPEKSGPLGETMLRSAIEEVLRK